MNHSLWFAPHCPPAPPAPLLAAAALSSHRYNRYLTMSTKLLSPCRTVTLNNASSSILRRPDVQFADKNSSFTLPYHRFAGRRYSLNDIEGMPSFFLFPPPKAAWFLGGYYIHAPLLD